MTATQKSQAQKLAALLSTESESEHSGVKYSTAKASAAELRRLHAYVVELESQLEAIGAGGVESLRKKGA